MDGKAARPIFLYGKQNQFLRLTCGLRGFVGGRGTGKTWIGSYTILATATKQQPWMCISPDAGVVLDTTYPTFLETSKEMGVFVRTVQSPYPKVWFRTHDGGMANLLFRSGEKPEKLRGPNKAGIWIDEASVQSQDVYDIALATLRFQGKSGPCLMTFTPRGRSHWTFEKFFQPVEDERIGNDGCSSDGIEWIQGKAYRHRPDTGLVHARSYDNPFLPENFAERLVGTYSSQFAAQEVEGEFVDILGLMFRREWFDSVTAAPRDAMRIRYWDKAATHGSGSYTAGVLMARDQRGICYVEDVVRGQWSAHERDRVIEQTAEADHHKYRGEVIIVAEQEGGSGGKEIAHQMVTKMAGYPVFRDIVSGGAKRRSVGGVELPGQAKVVRALGWNAQAEAGNVKLVRGDWNIDWLNEVTAFPESTHSDQVDATSGAFNRLAGRMFASAPAPTKKKVQPNSKRFGAAAVLERARARRLYDTERSRR